MFREILEHSRFVATLCERGMASEEIENETVSTEEYCGSSGIFKLGWQPACPLPRG